MGGPRYRISPQPYTIPPSGSTLMWYSKWPQVYPVPPHRPCINLYLLHLYLEVSLLDLDGSHAFAVVAHSFTVFVVLITAFCNIWPRSYYSSQVREWTHDKLWTWLWRYLHCTFQHSIATWLHARNTPRCTYITYVLLGSVCSPGWFLCSWRSSTTDWYNHCSCILCHWCVYSNWSGKNERPYVHTSPQYYL